MEVRSPLTGCRGVSLPFSDFAGPLWTDFTFAAEVLDALGKFARSRNWKHLEIRGGVPLPEAPETFQAYETHELDLRPRVEALARGLEPSVRRAIRKAESSGLEATVETGHDALKTFYQLHARTRRRHGLPPQPLSFFLSIGRHLMATGLGRVVIARLAGVPVAGAVFFHSGGRAIYKYGASDTRHWSLRPNQLVMWTAIRHLVQDGCHGLHFGRTSKGDEGLARFKLSWGCVSGPLRYHRYSTGTGTWLPAAPPRAESHPLIFGHLPLPLNRLAGRLIYPHLD